MSYRPDLSPPSAPADFFGLFTLFSDSKISNDITEENHTAKEVYMSKIYTLLYLSCTSTEGVFALCWW